MSLSHLALISNRFKKIAVRCFMGLVFLWTNMITTGKEPKHLNEGFNRNLHFFPNNIFEIILVKKKHVFSSGLHFASYLKNRETDLQTVFFS